VLLYREFSFFQGSFLFGWLSGSCWVLVDLASSDVCYRFFALFWWRIDVGLLLFWSTSFSIAIGQWLPSFYLDFLFSLSARIFFLFYGSYLSVGILFSFYWSYLSVKNCIVSDISLPQGEFPFPLLSSVIGRDLFIKNWFSSAISSPPLWLIFLSGNSLPKSHSPLLSFVRWMCYFVLSVQPLPID